MASRYAFENNEDIAEAMRCLGPDAKPTGRIRMVTNHPARADKLLNLCIEQEWTSYYGTGWIAIPEVEYVGAAPPVQRPTPRNSAVIRSFLEALGYKTKTEATEH